MGAYRVLHFEDADALPGPGSLTWIPVRQPLGIRAFGINAYTADEAGVDVVEPHTEGSGHEELYLVLAGRAAFTLDGEEVDAPAGTLIFLPEGGVHRHAVSREPGTLVLAVGGWPDRPFTASAWEWWFRAYGLAETGWLDEARAVMAEGTAERPEDASMAYHRACLEALGGDRDAAFAQLVRAIALGGDDMRGRAAADEDLAALRGDPRWALVVGSA
jgi:mannose-6-phosphate isomerase-like protein (cupin superfamily)